jgi:hypothetical protein
VFDFFTNTDALRRKDRFAQLLKTFTLLGVDTKPIVELRDLFNAINVSQLDKTNIATAIKFEKQKIIQSFLVAE